MIKNVLLFSYEIFIVTAEKIYSASFCNDDFKCSFSQTDVKEIQLHLPIDRNYQSAFN